MTLERAVQIARETLYDSPGFDIHRADAYEVLAKYHGRMDEMEKFAETYLKKETV